MHVIDVKKVLIIFFVYGMSFGHDLNIKVSHFVQIKRFGQVICGADISISFMLFCLQIDGCTHIIKFLTF